MSAKNEIPDSIDDEIKSAMKVILGIMTTIIGIPLGAIIGFYGTYFVCGLIGDGYGQAGWVLLYFTIPIGILAGAGLGCFLLLLLDSK